MRAPRRWPTVLAFLLFVVAITAVGVAISTLSSGDRTVRPSARASSGRGVPSEVAAIITRLVAPNGTLRLDAFTTDAAAILPRGAALASGSHVILDHSVWNRAGRFANSTGELLTPGTANRPLEIGFMLTTAGWKITFIEETT